MICPDCGEIRHKGDCVPDVRERFENKRGVGDHEPVEPRGPSTPPLHPHEP